MILAYPCDDNRREFGGLNGLERLQFVGRELIFQPARKLLDVLAVDVVRAHDHVERAVPLER